LVRAQTMALAMVNNVAHGNSSLATPQPSLNAVNATKEHQQNMADVLVSMHMMPLMMSLVVKNARPFVMH